MHLLHNHDEESTSLPQQFPGIIALGNPANRGRIAPVRYPYRTGAMLEGEGGPAIAMSREGELNETAGLGCLIGGGPSPV